MTYRGNKWRWFFLLDRILLFLSYLRNHLCAVILFNHIKLINVKILKIVVFLILFVGLCISPNFAQLLPVKWCAKEVPQFIIDSIEISHQGSDIVLCNMYFNESDFVNYDEFEIQINHPKNDSFISMAGPGVWVVAPHPTSGEVNLCGHNRFFRIVATCGKLVYESNIVYLGDVKCIYDPYVELRQNPDASEIVISPQPIADHFEIKNLKNNPIHAVILKNVQGQKLKEFRSNGLETYLRLEVPNLPSGIYFVEVHLENNLIHCKKISISSN